MKAILNFLFQRLPIVKKLDGYKTIFAAVFIVLSALAGALVDIIPMFPGAAFLGDAQGLIMGALKGLQELLEMLGYTFAGAGLLGKWAKK